MAKREFKTKKTDEDVVTPEVESNTTMVPGKLVGCKKLNIRKNPSVPKKDPLSNIVCSIDDKATIMVDLDKSKDEWFKVTVNNDIIGYCMKQYISIN